MALSDADAYYQAGTVASALIGMSKTLANKEQNAEQAKAAAGPNPDAVLNATITASPLSNQTSLPLVTRRPAAIRDVNAPVERFIVQPAVSSTRLGVLESRMSLKDLRTVLVTLCRPDTETDLGPAGSPARASLARFLTANGKPSSDRITQSVSFDIKDLQLDGKRGC
jgi:hypothetical protein